jgi:preprotein translocase subunit Sss1
MPIKNKADSFQARRRKRIDPDDEETTPGNSPIALWFLAGMAIVGIVCFVIGIVRHGFDWRNAWQAGSSLTVGIGFLAIGLLELEWLEKIIGFTDGISSGLYGLFWWSWRGSLSDSELLGRRGATTIWVLVGMGTFAFGCVVALRVFEF